MPEAIGNFKREAGNRVFRQYIQFAGGIHRAKHAAFYEDFLRDAGAALQPPWATQDTSAAGSPTLDHLTDGSNGIFRLLHDNQSEAQRLTLYFGDQLVIPMNKKPIIEGRLKVNFAGATFSADQRLVWGLASARNATLNSIVTNAWFRMEGADLSIFTEVDDGTTDDDDNDTGFDLVDDTFIDWIIDARNLAAVKFLLDLNDGEGWQLAGAPLSIPVATGNVQPFIEIQRDAGTEEEEVRIDYIAATWDRT